MTLELSKYIVYGEIFATRKNSVHGWIGLMGMDVAVHFELTGNCEPDLAGKHVRFRCRELPQFDFDESSVPNFQIRHVGPVGKITAALKVQVNRRGNPLPPAADGLDHGADWKDLLHIEWFSQNGRVVIELVDPVIQIVGPHTTGGDAADDFFGVLFPDNPELKGDRDPSRETIILDSATDAGDKESDVTLSDEDEDIGVYDDLFSSMGELHMDLGLNAELVEHANDEDEKVSKAMRETELMDDLIESGVGESIVSMLGDDTPLPEPAALTENEAETVLRVLLAQLARRGVSLNMCEHVTALEAYRIFIKDIAPEATCFSELQGTGWVQHYMTSEYCKECEREFEEEWKLREKGCEYGQTPALLE